MKATGLQHGLERGDYERSTSDTLDAVCSLLGGTAAGDDFFWLHEHVQRVWDPDMIWKNRRQCRQMSPVWSFSENPGSFDAAS